MNILRRGMLLGSTASLAVPALLAARPAAAQPAPAVAQAPSFYRFKVGSFTVTMLHDGFFQMPVEGFVRNAPGAEVQNLLAASFLDTTRLTIPFNAAVVDTGRALVALDTGTAGLNPTSQLLPLNMRAAGIDPLRITHVAISHFHGDHISGLLTGTERTYPNAEVVVPAPEWAWWTEEGNITRSPERQRGNFANTARRFAPYQGRVRQVADGAEVVPGIRAVATHGHTPGHTSFHIADGGQEAMYLADVTNRPELFVRHPDWHVIFDFDAEVAAAGRKRMLDRVATDKVRVMGYHFPFPANGHIAKDGQGFRYVPADWSGTV